jgi:hypothetical protein
LWDFHVNFPIPLNVLFVVPSQIDLGENLLNSSAQPNLSMKEGSLFCFMVMRSTEPGRFRSCSWVSTESSQLGGVHGLGWGLVGSMTFGLAVQKFLNIE